MGVGGIYGCGCKEVYRFPHSTPYSFCICSFLQQHPYFLFIFKMFFVLYNLTNDSLFLQLLPCFFLLDLVFGFKQVSYNVPENGITSVTVVILEGILNECITLNFSTI